MAATNVLQEQRELQKVIQSCTESDHDSLSSTLSEGVINYGEGLVSMTETG